MFISTADGSRHLWELPIDLSGLIATLENARVAERMELLRKLSSYGAQARSARPLLPRLVFEPANDVRDEAPSLLEKTGPADKGEAETLSRMLILRISPRHAFTPLNAWPNWC